ncbi:MAG: hypothetical protein H6617_01145 [Bdellovibrionaceae bacterium]|nr:hypothetical protein [Bdellovibrionales bacterium]MCB9253271.1 hypothetical protein [Pseudobdellovibrionaceae bacterium]
MKRKSASTTRSTGLASKLVAAIRIGFFSLLLFLVAGCAGYSSQVRKARHLFESGDFENSAKELEPLAAKESNDQLLYLLDLGLIYHSAGRYEDAIKTFLKAEKIADIKDYTSITAEAAAVITNEQVLPYKGEDFEKILINVFLAIDYTLAGKWDDALVECRRVNHKLDLMRQQGQLPYERNAFAKYLAAVLFEARGESNDAFVDYRQLASWKQGTPYLGAPLLRLAEKLHAEQEFQIYKKQFPSTSDYRIGRNEGEIIVLLEMGKGPVKVPNPSFRLVPMFERRNYRTAYAEVRVDSLAPVRTQTLFDIEATAIDQLQKKMAIIMARKVGGVVVKEVIAERVRKATDSEFLGLLTKVILHMTDQADLRSWSTLPASLQLARIRVPAGTHRVSLDLAYRSGGSRQSVKEWAEIKVGRGKKVFLNHHLRD